MVHLCLGARVDLLSLDLLAQWPLPLDEILVIVSSLVSAFCDPAKAIQVQLLEKCVHPACGEVLGHDFLCKILVLVYGKGPSMREEGNDVRLTILLGFMEDPVELDRKGFSGNRVWDSESVRLPGRGRTKVFFVVLLVFLILFSVVALAFLRMVAATPFFLLVTAFGSCRTLDGFVIVGCCCTFFILHGSGRIILLAAVRRISTRGQGWSILSGL